jgi:hypothetical protein
MTKRQQQERDEAIAKLRGILKPGDTVHTMLRHVSKSGMLRSISAIVVQPGDYRLEPGDTPEPVDISWLVAQAIGESLHNTGGVRMTGAGMDMGFSLVYTLSYVLYPKGFDCIGKGCPSNEHRGRDGEDYSSTRHHNEGGYALRHRWL